MLVVFSRYTLGTLDNAIPQISSCPIFSQNKINFKPLSDKYFTGGKVSVIVRFVKLHSFNLFCKIAFNGSLVAKGVFM